MRRKWRRVDGTSTVYSLAHILIGEPAATSPGYALGPDRIGHEAPARLALLPDQREAELAAPPQHVLGSLRPFVPHQIADLGAGEVGAEARAEIVGPRGAVKHLPCARAVGLDQPARMRLGEE